MIINFDEIAFLPFLCNFSVVFKFSFWAHMRKSKNDLSKVPTRCNLLSKRNYNCRDRRTLYGRIFGYRHYDKIVIFEFSFWAHMRKSKNHLSKVPTRCNLVPKINLDRRDRSTLSRRKFVYRHKKKKHIFVKPMHSSLRSESKSTLNTTDYTLSFAQ